MASQVPPIVGGGPQESLEPADFLSTQFVFGVGGLPSVGLDVLVTKVALDFVALTSEAGDNCVKRNLEALREATGVDALCIALLDADRKTIERVATSTGLLASFDPQVLKGEPVERLPLLTGKLDHLRIAEFRDTHAPRREHAVDAALLAELNVRSALVCGMALNDRVCGFMALLSSQTRKDGWDANLHLMLKLVGSSFATGLDRLRVQRYLGKLEERNELSLPSANDGLWDFDVENNTVITRRAGGRCSATTSTMSGSRPTGGGSCTRTTSRACRRRSATTLRARPRCSRASIACATSRATGAGS
jgi:hypothetical protein